MHLILITGLPGTGKSTLAEALSQKTCIPVFSKDLIEAALLRCDITTVMQGRQPVSYAVYEILFTLAEQQLRLGQSCIVDCVASHQAIRNRLKLLSKKYRARWTIIECICSNEALHKERLTTRQRNIPGYRELDWDHLLKTRDRYVLWEEEHKTIDAVNQIETNTNEALLYISR